jgi:hypothetical protein
MQAERGSQLSDPDQTNAADGSNCKGVGKRGGGWSSVCYRQYGVQCLALC